jgi:RecB family endonuclease NucS
VSFIVRVVFAECSAIYAGRGDTTLERALRAILIKRDGSVSIHNDSANKPMNYMKMASLEKTFDEHGNEVWKFDARHESLAITIYEILGEVDKELVDKDSDPGGEASGTEAHLQKWIFENPSALGEGFTAVQREFATGAGSVDLLVLSPEGKPVAVEVKRVATLGAVDQVRRYVDSMRALENRIMLHPITRAEIPVNFSETTGLIAALDLRPKMLELAEKRGVPSVLIPAYWKHGDEDAVRAIESATQSSGPKSLFD